MPETSDSVPGWQGRRRATGNEFADQLWCREGDHLHCAAAHGESEEVDLLEIECADQGDDVVGPTLECICDDAGAATYASLVEDDDLAVCAERIQKEWIL